MYINDKQIIHWKVRFESSNWHGNMKKTNQRQLEANEKNSFKPV